MNRLLISTAVATLLACAGPGTGEQGQFELLVASTPDAQLRPLGAGFTIELTLNQLAETDIDEVVRLASSNPEVLEDLNAVPMVPMQSNGDRQTFTLTAISAGTVRLAALASDGRELDAFQVEVAEPTDVALIDDGIADLKEVKVKPQDKRLMRVRVRDQARRELVTGDEPGNLIWSTGDGVVATVAQTTRCEVTCRPAFPSMPQAHLAANEVGRTRVAVAMTARALSAEIPVIVEP